jgi:hypothetical protein
MSVKKLVLKTPGSTLEPEYLQKVLIAAAQADARIISQVRQELLHRAAQSVLEARRSDKEK